MKAWREQGHLKCLRAQGPLRCRHKGMIHLTLRQNHGRYGGQSKHNRTFSTGAKKTDEIERKKNRKQIKPETVLPSYIIDKPQ